MKTHHTKNKPKSKKHTKQNLNAGTDIDDLADQLVELSQKLLHTGALPRVIKGHEDDIRQEAILMALSWYLRDTRNPPGKTTHPWNAPKALAGAMRIAKRDHFKWVKTEMDKVEGAALQNNTAMLHPSMVSFSEWPLDTIQWLTFTAIRIALKSGKISHANAAVAQEVLVDGAHVIDVAKRLGTHRSNIYQHLTRVRRYLPEIIDSIEVPLEKVQ